MAELQTFSPPDDLKHEYAKLFYEQNKLLWSRLQTAYLVEAGTLTAFYVLLKDRQPEIALGTCILGSVLLFVLLLILVRDVQFHTAMRQWLPLATISPTWRTLGIRGKYFAIVIPIVLIVANAILVLCTMDLKLEFREAFLK